MQKNVAGQKWIVFAFDETDNTPKPGDAAQITAEISKDGAAGGGNIADTNPTELEDGYYVFDIAQGESNADLLAILPESSTGNIQVVGVPGAIWTTEPNRNKLSVDSNGRIDVSKVAGTAQTANDNGADINAILEDTNEIQGKLPTNKFMGSSDGADDDGTLNTIATDAARLTAARAAILTDWINGGRLDLLLDAIKTVADAILVDTDTTIPALVGGGGDTAFTYTLTSDAGGAAIPNAHIWITSDEAGLAVIASGYTDQYGQVTFYLDTGIIYVWRTHADYSFTNPDQETVS